MKHSIITQIAIVGLFLAVSFSIASNVEAQALPDMDFVTAVTTSPGTGKADPILPSLSYKMRGWIGNELNSSKAILEAYKKLDARRQNTEWIVGLEELEKQKALWSLLSCLCHPSPDVQNTALRSLERIKDQRAVPSLLLYADYMDFMVMIGSENVTLQGIIHQSIAKTLSTLTGVKVVLHSGQDLKGLEAGIKMWSRWQVEHGVPVDSLGQLMK